MGVVSLSLEGKAILADSCAQEVKCLSRSDIARRCRALMVAGRVAEEAIEELILDLREVRAVEAIKPSRGRCGAFRWLQSCWPKCGAASVGLVPFAELSPGSFAAVVRRAAGVGGFHVHQMGHTFACQWLERGGNLAALQQVLGHASIETTQRYARLTDDAVMREAERLGRASI